MNCQRRTTEARAASNSHWTNARVLAPSRLVLGGGSVVSERVHASPAPSLSVTKIACAILRAVSDSVTGLANLGIGSGTLH